MVPSAQVTCTGPSTSGRRDAVRAQVCLSVQGMLGSVDGGVRYGLLTEILLTEGYLLGCSVLNMRAGNLQICGYTAGGVLVNVLAPRRALLTGTALFVVSAAVARIGLARMLRDCRRRGMRGPELVIGDGAMGLWWALPRCSRRPGPWVHKARNIANCLPKSAQPGATKAMQEIYNAEDRTHAEKAIEAFAKTYGAKFPKAVAEITEDPDELLAFYDFPAEHWIHLRSTNPIESTFSTVKFRTKVMRGAGSPAAALAMVSNIKGKLQSAQARWRAITGAHLVSLVRAGAQFENGVLVEREEPAA